MISLTDLLHPSPAPHFKMLQVFLIYVLKCPGFSTIQNYAANVVSYSFLPQILVNFAGQRNHLCVEHCCFYIYLLIAIGLTPGFSSTVHIYTQTIHRTTQ